jgi:hypothetical protein
MTAGHMRDQPAIHALPQVLTAAIPQREKPSSALVDGAKGFPFVHHGQKLLNHETFGITSMAAACTCATITIAETPCRPCNQLGMCFCDMCAACGTHIAAKFTHSSGFTSPPS